MRKLIAAVAVAASAMAANARSLIHYFDFDTLSGSGLAYTDVDKGTSPANFTFKNNGSASLGYTMGALGSDRAGIDELAVFDYPVTAEQVKWLAKYRPAQPAAGPGRAMPVAFLLDTLASSGGIQVDNSGTGTETAYEWKSGYVNYPTKWTGALGSGYAFHLKDVTTLRIDGASATEGLGASLNSGMALSFWIKAPQTFSSLWWDFISFRIGNRYERFEWNVSNPPHFTVFGSSGTPGENGLPVVKVLTDDLIDELGPKILKEYFRT